MTEESPMFRQYFHWLYDRVCAERDIESDNSYTLVADVMHRNKFQVIVPLDENRVADAAELRNGFVRTRIREPLDASSIIYPDATIFEVLVALALKAQIMVEIPMREWFAIFLENLDLRQFDDRFCLGGYPPIIGKRLKKFNERKYRPNGQGGLFPLKRPLQDQRTVELWYQMGAYMNENHLY